MGPEKMEYLILWQNLQILSFTKKTYEKIVKWSRKWQPEKYKIVQSKKNIDIGRNEINDQYKNQTGWVTLLSWVNPYPLSLAPVTSYLNDPLLHLAIGEGKHQRKKHGSLVPGEKPWTILANGNLTGSWIRFWPVSELMTVMMRDW